MSWPRRSSLSPPIFKARSGNMLRRWMRSARSCRRRSRDFWARAEPRAERRGSEPFQQAPEIVDLRIRACALARAAPDLLQQIARPSIDILALKQVFLRARVAALSGLAAQRIGLRHAGLAALGSGAAGIGVLRHRLAHVAHPFAQRLHGVGLLAERACKVVIAQ